MTNNQTDNSKNATQQGLSNTDKQNQEQKKGFEQGNGNNSTTADPKKKEWDQKNDHQSQDTGGQNQSKITNQDSKITNKDEGLKKDPKAQGEINDDEDVDENGQLEGYKEEEPEIDTPVMDNEKTEKKKPEMKK